MSHLIKKPYEHTEYTQENIFELHRCASDPIYFIRKYIKIQHPKRGAIPFDLFPYQERAIRAFQENRWVITLQSRQSGKTTVIAAYLLWYASFHNDKTVLVASNKNSNAMEIMHRIKFAYEELPNWLKPGCHYYTKHSMEFDNGSKVFSEATTENTGRGKSISLLMLDELAYVKKTIQDAMWTSLLPTLSTGGGCIVSSTPNGDNDLFAQLWRQANLGVQEEGGIDFFPVEVHWKEHPDRDEKFKAEILPKLGEEKWLQEYENQFLSSDALLIKTIVLQNTKTSIPIYIDKGFKFWKEPDPTKSYIVGVDVSEGLGRDFSTIQVLELQTLEQVAEFRDNKINETQFYHAIKYLLNKLSTTKDAQTGRTPDIYWSYENNAIGAAIQALYLNDEKFPQKPELVSIGNTLGTRTTSKTKIVACKNLKRLLERVNAPMKINSEQLLMELKNYVLSGGSYAAKQGATDDLISAMLVVMNIMLYLSEHDESVFGQMYSSESDFFDDKEVDNFDEPVPFVLSGRL